MVTTRANKKSQEEKKPRRSQRIKDLKKRTQEASSILRSKQSGKMSSPNGMEAGDSSVSSESTEDNVQKNESIIFIGGKCWMCQGLDRFDSDDEIDDESSIYWSGYQVCNACGYIPEIGTFVQNISSPKH